MFRQIFINFGRNFGQNSGQINHLYDNSGQRNKENLCLLFVQKTVNKITNC
jgi:hypothetical protein